MRVLFEGNILLTAWLQDLHCVSFTELTSSLSSAGDFSPSASVIHAQVLLSALRHERSLAFFCPSPSLPAVFCE